MSCGGWFGGAAGQVEPLSRKELCPARGGHTEGQFVLEVRMCAFHIRYTVGIKIGQFWCFIFQPLRFLLVNIYTVGLKSWALPKSVNLDEYQ